MVLHSILNPLFFPPNPKHQLQPNQTFPIPSSFSTSLILHRRFLTFMAGEHHIVEQKLHEKYGHVIRTGPNSLSFSDLGDFEAIYGFHKSIEKDEFYDFGRDRVKNSES